MVRTARPHDAGEVARLAELMYRSLGIVLDDEVWETWRGTARAAVSGLLGATLTVVVAENPSAPDRLVACGAGVISERLPNPAHASARVGYVQWMSTEPGFRRQGYARAVLRGLLDWFGSNGVDNVELHASADGKALYRSEGFLGREHRSGPAAPSLGPRSRSVSPSTGPGGYSGTPLAKKLGVRAGDVVALVGAPRGWTVPDLPDGARTTRASGTGADVVIAFVRRALDLEEVVAEGAGVLGPEDALWVLWPRRVGGHDSDVTDNLVREVVLRTGLVDVKVAAVGEDWSGLRFVWRKERRGGLSARPRRGPGR